MASQGISMPSIPSKSEAQPIVSTSTDATSKPKPCCVCKNEKSKRDECMLFSKAADPAGDCKTTIDQYRSCMAGFGFQV
ncbi:cytochrome C oxidase copper chaperone-domain-containing protein [Hypoxylon trugodes]|uniref:cytochrome C oxidase copper chaperone-domain-containing protein n=1 Tax=Hypoxylon trugodes TaxID=326681 RepID=UPI0021900770|nr:cytochrome C oxidase copper chaperone-domain-containing protein [Hypoxylon trugodes]KAI1383500.1 cytochrome C oxidase copper chaperone-domain-containing protein [Hypoxylon trugodes]